MKRSVCVLLSSNELEFQANCKRFLSSCGVHVLCEERDGRKTLDMIKKFRPEVTVLNATMPFFDSASVAHIAHELKDCVPRFVVISDVADPALKKENIEAGVDVYLVRPVSEQQILKSSLNLLSSVTWQNKRAIPQRNLVMQYDLSRIDLALLVTDVILDLGVPSHVDGYRYLKEAALFCLENDLTTFSVTKEIYPMLSKLNGVTAASIEHSIRHAISMVWRDNKLMPKALIAKPTNSQFILFIVEELRLRLNMKQAV